MRARAVTFRRSGAIAALCFAAAAGHAQSSVQSADTVRYPYVAALSRSTSGERVYFCAGALVAPRWILTAAHCFHTPRGGLITSQGLTVEVGARRLREVPIRAQVAVARIILHPDYDPERQDNDIALVELAQEAGPLTAEVAMSRPAEDPEQATVLGFGSFYEGRLAANALSRSGAPASQLSDRLRQAVVRVVDPASCATRLGAGSGEAGAYRICGDGGPDATCVGDSGGPLIVQGDDRTDRVAGIVSLGTGCAAARPVTVYTRVSAYAGWIAATIAGR